VVAREGRYLVGRRPAAKRHGGLWEFPGGKVEPGETDAEAMARELREELAVAVTSLGAECFVRHDAGSPYEIVFIEVAIAGAPQALEHEAIGWFTPAELRSMPLAPSDAAFAETLMPAIGGASPTPAA
jgi:8-oxo-dGTP diphosphatase